MDKQRYIEHMLEAENLTDALDDADASWLLDWGAARLEDLLQGVADRETADHRASALMAVMRRLNMFLGSYRQKDPSALVEDLAALHGLFAAAFPAAGAPSEQPDFQKIAGCISQLSPRQALEFFARDFSPPGRDACI